MLCYRGYVTVPARSQTALGYWQRMAYIAAMVVAGPAMLIAAIGAVRVLRERRRQRHRGRPARGREAAGH